MDSLSAILLMFGLIMLVASWLYLMIIAFQADYAWGLTTVFLPPLSYLYGFFALDKAKAPLWMAGGGWVCILLSL